MNKVILIGRLTANPELKEGQNSYCRFALAVDRKKRDEQADFINCVVFGKGGEFAERYLKKGTKIAVTGRIQTGSYTNKEGVKVYTTDIIADNIEFAESKGASEGSSGGQSYQAPQGGTAAPAPADDGFMNIPDGIEEELPFS